MKVTFVTEKHVNVVAFFLPEDTTVSQYDVDHEGGEKIFAIIWEHPEEDKVMDLFPVAAITLPWVTALPTLSEVFGLYIPCVPA